jgi:GntR family transcriptional regulator
MPHSLDRRPRYLQAAEALSVLLNGAYAPGDLLPAAEQLAEQIGVSRSTLREAMGYLEHEGRLIRKQGVGTFVAKATAGRLVNRLEQLSGLRSLAASAGLSAEVVEQDVVVETATDDEAALVNLAPGSPVAHVRIVISVGGQRVAFFDSIVAAKRVEIGSLRQRRQTLLEHLLCFGQPAPVYTDSRIFAIRANEEVAKRLDIVSGDPILLMTESFYAADGRQLVHQHAYLLSDMIDYRIVRRITMRPGSWESAPQAQVNPAVAEVLAA